MARDDIPKNANEYHAQILKVAQEQLSKRCLYVCATVVVGFVCLLLGVLRSKDPGWIELAIALIGPAGAVSYFSKYSSKRVAVQRRRIQQLQDRLKESESLAIEKARQVTEMQVLVAGLEREIYTLRSQGVRLAISADSTLLPYLGERDENSTSDADG
ncbi:MAG: hypothetical protein QOJ65_2598 [Fimbriimonadaceae bacterium]|jgi:hypothetical protein|nr:hypothetical protein [Fimbriimonadaceae bacterium]